MNNSGNILTSINWDWLSWAKDFEVIWNISDSITDILDWDSRILVESRQNKLNDLVQQLQIETALITERIGYDYKCDDYRQRLLFDKKPIKKFFLKLLNDNPRLKIIYWELIQFSEWLLNSDNFLEWIWTTYFEDLVYESIAPKYPKANNLLKKYEWSWDINSFKCSALDFVELYDLLYSAVVQSAWAISIQFLMPKTNFTLNMFNELIDFIHCAWNNWIKYLDFYHWHLSILNEDKELLIELVRQHD